MNLAGNIMIDTYSILIITVICIHSLWHSEFKSLQNRLYSAVLITTMIQLVLDFLGRFDGNPGTIYSEFNYWGNLGSFATNLTLPSLWFLYIHNQVFGDIKKIKKFAFFLAGINILNVIIILISLPYGWFYHIDSGNIYHRGPYYLIPVMVMIIMMLSAFLFLIKNRRRIEKKYFLSLLFFAIPPFVCIFLQLIFYGVSLMLNSVVLSLLIVYFNIQNRYIYTDYLTGVSNRRKLESHLKGRISCCDENDAFSAILIDMDNFKSINDNFGHDVGDDALFTFVQLLKACLRSDDFIARFGGDEFYIILNISDREILENTVARIKKTIRNFNDSEAKPYKLEFSVGYALYDVNSRMGMDEFQKQLDKLMYADKRLAKDKLVLKGS